MKEQPSSDSEDLFDWAVNNNPQSTESVSETFTPEMSEETFEPGCPQCEVGYTCPKHPKAFNAPVPISFTSADSSLPVFTDEDLESSNRIADKEYKQQQQQKALEQPVTDEELQQFFGDWKQDRAS